MKYVIAILSLAVVSMPASGQTCSSSTIRGTYGLVCTGFISPAQGAPQVPISVLGTVIGGFDGGFSGGAQVSMGGAIVTQTVSGPSTLNSDCTGSITYTQKINGQPAPPLNIVFHVLDQGKEIRGMSVDTGTTMVCSLKLISR